MEIGSNFSTKLGIATAGVIMPCNSKTKESVSKSITNAFIVLLIASSDNRNLLDKKNGIRY